MFYKDEVKLSDRINESMIICSKYPDKIPVIVDCSNKELFSKIKKRKFLVPGNISVSYLISVIRNKLELDSKKSIIIFCDNRMLCGTEIVSTIYDDYSKSDKSEYYKGDRYLYVQIEFENTFG